MTQLQFEEKLEKVLYEMDDDDYIELAQSVAIPDADTVHRMSEFDDYMSDYSPSELIEWYEGQSDFTIGSEYFTENFETFDDPRDIFEVDDIVDSIVEHMYHYGVREIDKLIDVYTTITEDEILDKILEANEEGLEVRLIIDGTEFKIKKNEQKGNGDE